MSLVINTNLSSQNAQRQLMRSGASLDLATQRLSSGKRINSAADDAAGMAISNRMTSQVRGLDQAIRNANDGVSLIQVAEGALSETSNMLQRIRELSVQAANGVYSDGDRATLNAEVKQLLAQIDFVAKNTQFNGVAILDGSQRNVSLQVGAEANQVVKMKLPAVSTKSLGMGSTSGDLVGASASISGTGYMVESVPAGAFKINGTALDAITSSTKFKDVINDINNKISDVEASSFVKLQADGIGTGILQGSAKLTLNAIDLDGNSVSIQIANTSSLAQLADEIAAQSSGLFQASINDDGKLIITSSTYSTFTAVDSTAGVATGISASGNSDPDIANIIQALQTYWVSEAENLISTFFGMTGDGRDLTLNLQTIANGQSDGANGALASVDPNTFTLNIDMEDFGGVALPDGPSSGGWLYGDRIITHEMVHAVMASRMNLGGLPGWFAEGVAELIHGADERVEIDIANGSFDNIGEFQAVFAAAQAAGSPAAEGYSAGFVAVRMMHDSILQAGGADGIKLIFDELESGATFNQALTTVATNVGITAWTDQSTFNTWIDAYGYDYMTNAVNATLDGHVGAGKRIHLDGGVGVESDTGSIMGSEYGFSAKNAVGVIPNLTNSPAQNFNFIIPSEYGGGTATADAQLILTSKSGSSIQITKGLGGTDDMLKSLGFVETRNTEVLGMDLSQAEQSTALAAGDLVINGVEVGRSLSGDGLIGKINAINDLSQETGVVADIVAKAAYRYDANVYREYTSTISSNAALDSQTLGINGIGVAITAGWSLQQVAEAINATEFAHGAKAYVDESGKFHLFSKQPLNLGHANVDAPSTGFFNDVGLTLNANNSGSVVIKGVNVGLSDIYNIQTVVSELNAVQAQTGVSAVINDNGELQFQAAASFSLSLGNTNGLMTFTALGIDVTMATSGSGLADTDNDNLLSDEKVSVLARIRLTSQNDSPISIQLTTTGKTATGLVEQNSEAAVISGSSLRSLSIETASGAQKAIGIVDKALTSINEVRSQLGAINNRLDFTIANLSNISEKTTAALSRIVDADYAGETAKLSRAQVLQQASQAMLAQANARPQQILTLLR